MIYVITGARPGFGHKIDEKEQYDRQMCRSQLLDQEKYRT